MKKINDYLYQKEEHTVALKNCKITIELNVYEGSKSLEIREDEGVIYVPSLIALLEFKDSYLNVVLDYPALIRLNDSFKKTTEDIQISYSPKEVIFSITAEDAGNAGSEMSYIDRLIGGREIFKDEIHLFKKMSSVYQNLSTMDSIHIEILESQTLRDSTDISIPARLGKTWNPTLVNLKATVFNEGIVQGLAFENVGKAITNGLISGQNKQPSILEDVMSGNIVETTKNKR